MPLPEPRVYRLEFASGATSTNSVYVGNYHAIWLYHSGLTAINAGTGNMNMNLLGGFDTKNYTSALTLFDIDGSSITTMNGGAVHRFYSNHYPVGIPRLAVQFGTAVTGAATNAVYLIVAE